jgi:hypothetical protein
VAHWQPWEGPGVEHLFLQLGADGAIAEGMVLGVADGVEFAARYRIVCDAQWRTRRIEVEMEADDRRLALASDGEGTWTDVEEVLPALQGALDVDITATPFTNTLPVRRLGLAVGGSQELVVVYVSLPGFAVTTDRQRYTRIGPQAYRFESPANDFVREIEVDGDGLVVSYPGLFRRVG